VRARASVAVSIGVLAAFGCGTAGPPAIRVRVLVSADVAATCIVLQATGAGGAHHEARAPRGPGSGDIHFTIERGDLPDRVTLQAMAGSGRGCADPLSFSTASAEQEGAFASPPGAAVILELSPPPASSDADRDGFSSVGSGGGDCDDQDRAIHPGAPEVCWLGVDADCDGMAGCDDPDCSAVPCSRAATRLAFTSPPQAVEGGACSSMVQLHALDASGAKAAVPEEMAVSFSVPTPDALRVFADPACLVPMESAKLAPGPAGLGFYVQGVTGGDHPLEAATSELGTATQTFSVRPMVRAGRCTLENGSSSVSCPLPFPVNPARSLLVFQATMDDETVSSTNVRCSITSGVDVVCSRVGSSATTTIGWQVLQRPRGLSAQHLRVPIGSNVTRVTLTPPVSPPSSFLLVSYENSGSEQGADDFRHLRLTRADEVEIRSSGGGGGTMEVTVAELAGAAVTRGLTRPMDGLRLDVGNLTPADVSRAFLTYSFRTQSGADQMCDRTLRGELTSATSLRFSRGDGNPTCAGTLVDAIAWERVELPPGWRVQQLEVALAAGEGTGVVPLARPVDVTRTLVLAGGQYTAGQAMGEGSYDQRDVLGEMLGRLELTGPAELTVSRGASLGSARWTAFVVEVPP
jgi:hypothetical protein